MHDVITVGNGIFDVFLTLSSSDTRCHLDEKTNEVCLPAGEKVLLNGCAFHLGGNACNVAVGLSRLGYKVALMAELGDDEFSEKIIKGLQEEEVDLSLLQQNPGHSSFAVGLSFQGERTLLVNHQERAHKFSFADLQTKWIYLTSLGNEWQHVYEAVAAYKKQSQVFLACNPGSVQLQAGAETFSYLFPLIDILFLSRSEAERVLKKEGSMEALLTELIRLGPQAVCLTDGKKGASVMTSDGKIYTQEPFPAEVVEVTGAGDSFAAGFLGAVLAGKTAQEALAWGTVNASSVIEHIGSQPGLLTRDGLEQRLTGGSL